MRDLSVRDDSSVDVMTEGVLSVISSISNVSSCGSVVNVVVVMSAFVLCMCLCDLL